MSFDVPVDHKLIKRDLNEALSEAVKLLQHESITQLSNNGILTSECDAVQQFISIIEAAFIHGLKRIYFERPKSKTALPSPQFWNLLRKISHNSAISQIRDFNFIRDRIGQCRAWLRLALNEYSLCSYLTLLLRGSEYSSLVQAHYEPHSLFLDLEQCDIFLRYLQGIGNLAFEVACNSSVLNLWTRTPLELSGIVNPTSAKLHMQKSAKISRSTLDVAHTPNPVSSPSSNSLNLTWPDESRGRSSVLLRVPPVSPLISPQLSPTGSTVHISPSSETENLFEITIVPGNDEEEGAFSDAVLHRRLLSLKKTKFKHTNADGTLANRSRSSCDLSQRTSDPSSETPRHPVLVRRTSSFNGVSTNRRLGSSEELDVDTFAFQRPRSEHVEISATTTTGTSEQLSDRHEAAVDKKLDADIGLTESDGVSGGNARDRSAVSVAVESVDSSSENRDASFPFKAAESNSFTSVSPPPPSSDDHYDDIYARSSSSSINTSPEKFRPASLSSSGRGNSLMFINGWSSDQEVDGRVSPSRDLSPSPCDHSCHSEGNDNVHFTIREGFLKKQKSSFQPWRARWFVLTSRTLAYYRDENCKERLGCLNLADIESIDDDDLKRKKSIR